MSCHVMSCHVMSCHVISCHVMSGHVMSCHSMLGQGLKPCDVMLVVEFVEVSWPVLGLCWPFGPSWGLRRPMLGSMLALWAHLGPIWAHVEGYVGPSWGLCWRILDRKTAQNNDRLKRINNGSKTLSPAACGAPRSAPGSPGGPKNGPSLATSQTSVVDIPTCFHNAAKRAYKTRFVLPPARNRVFRARLGPSHRHVGPSWAPCWPILEAPRAPFWTMSSQTARWAPRKPRPEALPSGRSRAHERANARVSASETTPGGSPQRPVARTPTLHCAGRRLGNRVPRLSLAACRAHTNAPTHTQSAKTLQNASFTRSKARKHRKTRGFGHPKNHLWRLSPAACRAPAEPRGASKTPNAAWNRKCLQTRRLRGDTPPLTC